MSNKENMTATERKSHCEPTVYQLHSAAAGIKILGERYLESDTQINCDWTGSGFEMDIEHAGGEIVFTAAASANCFFRAYVDGETWEKSDYEDPAFFLVTTEISRISLRDVPAGKHRIKLIKVTGYTLARAQVMSVSLCGTICGEAPQKNPLFIEFVGDSICCGWGTIGNHVGTYTDQDGTLAYPLKIAKTLNADYAVTALSGQGLLCGNPGMTDGYLYGSALRSRDHEYSFARKPDIVVINIGTNDFYLRKEHNIDAEKFKASYLAFLNTVAEKNGPDCKIYCLYKTMNDTFHEVLLEACSEFGAAVKPVTTFEMTRTASGHPTIEENIQYTADILKLLGYGA